MAKLSVAASAPGWESTISAMRAMPRTIKSEVSKRGRDIAEPLAKEIRSEGNSQGSHAGSVADTVKSGMKAGVPAVTAGGKPYTMGSEWGGGIRRTTHYNTHRLSGRRYLVVNRASTRQFRPHKGNEGYWFTPTIQEGKGRQAVMKAWGDLVDDVIARM